jgi:hypothetical protein
MIRREFASPSSFIRQSTSLRQLQPYLEVQELVTEPSPAFLHRPNLEGNINIDDH